MKKKAVVLFAAIAITLLTVKSGYAYYENVMQKEENKNVSVTQTNEQVRKVAAAAIPVETTTSTVKIITQKASIVVEVITKA